MSITGQETSNYNERLTRNAVECGIPSYMIDGLVRYLVDHVPTGDFLRAVLENNLMRALDKADITNSPLLRNYARFLYNYAPLGSYGSRENVRKWLER